MIGFRVVDLLVPGDPAQFTVAGAVGDWVFAQDRNFAASKTAITAGHQCAETFTAEHPVSMANGAAACDVAVGELLPLCLGASYLTGRSVTIKRSLPASDVQFLQVDPRFPRARSMNSPEAVVNTPAEFEAGLRDFVVAYPRAGQTEKIRLVVHHWLDAMACWALEDLYLSATTILQIIGATEEAKTPMSRPSFYNRVRAASARYGVPMLSPDFKDMRNDLIHDGTLSGSTFTRKTAADCAAVAVDALNWIDQYIHAALGMGPVRRVRFGPQALDNLNSYSL